MSLKTMLKNHPIRSSISGGAGVAAIALVAALAFAPSSGADFTAKGSGTANVNTANLSVDFNNSQSTFNVTYDNVKPGDNSYRTFTVRNTGSIAADVSLHARDLTVTGGDSPNLKQLSFHVEGYNPPSSTATVDDTTFQLGTLNPGEARTYELYITLDHAAGNEWQNVKLVSNLDVTLTQHN